MLRGQGTVLACIVADGAYGALVLAGYNFDNLVVGQQDDDNDDSDLDKRRLRRTRTSLTWTN